MPEKSRSEAVTVLNIFVLGGWLVVTAASFPSLPTRIPIHFRLNGVADAWAGRNSWFILPILASALVLFIHLVCRPLLNLPNLSNPSDRKHIASRDLIAQQRVRDTYRLVPALGALGLTIVLMIVHREVYVAAVSRNTRLSTGTTVAVLLGILATVFGMIQAAWYARRDKTS